MGNKGLVSLFLLSVVSTSLHAFEVPASPQDAEKRLLAIGSLGADEVTVSSDDRIQTPNGREIPSLVGTKLKLIAILDAPKVSLLNESPQTLAVRKSGSHIFIHQHVPAKSGQMLNVFVWVPKEFLTQEFQKAIAGWKVEFE